MFCNKMIKLILFCFGFFSISAELVGSSSIKKVLGLKSKKLANSNQVDAKADYFCPVVKRRDEHAMEWLDNRNRFKKTRFINVGDEKKSEASCYNFLSAVFCFCSMDDER